MTPILVIGGTGNVGRQVVGQLADAGVPVRAISRNPGAATPDPRIELIQGDLTAPETLDPALDGVDAVFLVWTAPPATFSSALERIAVRARRLVFLSAPIKTPHPFFQQPNPLREMTASFERQIESSGLEWTFLRPGMLASNALLWWAGQIRTRDVVRWPYLSVPTAPIDERDIAAVALRALCQDGHAGRDYVITGPESLTHADQIATIARVIGRPLRAEEMTPEEARRELLYIGPPAIIDMLLSAWAAGAGHPAFMTSTVEQITGKPARTFLEWAKDNVTAFTVAPIHAQHGARSNQTSS